MLQPDTKNGTNYSNVATIILVENLRIRKLEIWVRGEGLVNSAGI